MPDKSARQHSQHVKGDVERGQGHHEGTFGIQSLDLLGRKVLGDGGRALSGLIAAFGPTIAAAEGSELAVHAAALRAAGIHNIIVVTGYFHALIEAELNEQGVGIVRNPKPEDGQQASVRLGLSQLREPFDFSFITLADQHLLAAADFIELIHAFSDRQPKTDIRYPLVNGQRGNPVAISKDVVSTIVAAPASVTCKGFIQEHPERVDPYPTDNDHFILDIDTTEDLAAFKTRTGIELQRPA